MLARSFKSKPKNAGSRVRSFPLLVALLLMLLACCTYSSSSGALCLQHEQCLLRITPIKQSSMNTTARILPTRCLFRLGRVRRRIDLAKPGPFFHPHCRGVSAAAAAVAGSRRCFSNYNSNDDEYYHNDVFGYDSELDSADACEEEKDDDEFDLEAQYPATSIQQLRKIAAYRGLKTTGSKKELLWRIYRDEDSEDESCSDDTHNPDRERSVAHEKEKAEEDGLYRVTTTQRLAASA